MNWAGWIAVGVALGVALAVAVGALVHAAREGSQRHPGAQVQRLQDLWREGRREREAERDERLAGDLGDHLGDQSRPAHRRHGS